MCLLVGRETFDQLHKACFVGADRAAMRFPPLSGAVSSSLNVRFCVHMLLCTRSTHNVLR